MIHLPFRALDCSAIRKIRTADCGVAMNARVSGQLRVNSGSSAARPTTCQAPQKTDEIAAVPKTSGAVSCLEHRRQEASPTDHSTVVRRTPASPPLIDGTTFAKSEAQDG